MLHEQKFKDLLSNTFQVSVERIVLDLESEGPGSIPTGGNILSLDFFHVVKPLMPILTLLPILSICEKLDYVKKRLERWHMVNSYVLTSCTNYGNFCFLMEHSAYINARCLVK